MPLVNKLRRGLEKLVAPQANVSYAAAGEDLVLDALLGHRQSGFYVDVGCNHARKASNSYRFYRKGWRGIAIDANPAFAPEYARVRPRDRFVRACVSDTQREVPFHFFAEDALSSISGERFYDNSDHYALLKTETMMTRTLDEILDETKAPADFEFLSIDIEGHDEPALRSLDLRRYRPNVIAIELNAVALDLNHIGQSSVAQYLAGYGYQPIAAHWATVFFREQVAGTGG